MNKLSLVVLIAVSTLFYAQLTWTDSMRPEVCNYKGQVKNGMKHGYGKCTFYDGSYYEGSWKNDKRNGEGQMYDTRAGTTIIANFKNDYVDGNCRFIYANGDRFVGTCKKNKRYTGKYFSRSNGISYFSKGVLIKR